MTGDSRLVYSSDPKQNEKLQNKCPKCKEPVAHCACAPEASASSKFVAVLRIEKQGRGGKTVTVIDRLPKNELFLKNLTTLLKKKCGSGGTYKMDGKDGVIEIQGEKLPLVRACLEQQKISHKGGG